MVTKTSKNASEQNVSASTGTTSSMWFIILVSSAAGLGGLLYGYDTAVISGAIGFIQELYALSPAMEGFVISSIMLGGVIGVGFSGFLGDKIGRKKVLIIAAIVFAISAILSAIASTVWVLIIARIIGGLGIGMASALSVTYITECAPPHIRGRLSSMYQLFTIIGLSATYFINLGIVNMGDNSWGVQTGWRYMLAVGVIPAIIFAVTLIFVPESPRYLARVGRNAEAKLILNKINGSEVGAKEFALIEKSITEEKNTSLKMLLEPGLRKALGVGIFLAIFNQAIGYNSITYYGPEIFKMLGYVDNGSFVATCIVGIVNIIATFIAVFLIDSAGRKKLMAIGSLLMAIFAGLMSWQFSLETPNVTMTLIFIIGFVTAFCMSMGPIPWIMIPEIFPNYLRARATGVVTIFLWGANFCIGQFTPMLLKGWGPAATYLLFAAINLICFIFVLTIVPETKNKSLEEIEKFWTPKAK